MEKGWRKKKEKNTVLGIKQRMGWKKERKEKCASQGDEFVRAVADEQRYECTCEHIFASHLGVDLVTEAEPVHG